MRNVPKVLKKLKGKRRPAKHDLQSIESSKTATAESTSSVCLHNTSTSPRLSEIVFTADEEPIFDIYRWTSEEVQLLDPTEQKQIHVDYRQNLFFVCWKTREALCLYSIIGLALITRKFWLLHGINLMLLRPIIQITYAWTMWFCAKKELRDFIFLCFHQIRFYLDHTDTAMRRNFSFQRIVAVFWANVWLTDRGRALLYAFWNHYRGIMKRSFYQNYEAYQKINQEMLERYRKSEQLQEQLQERLRDLVKSPKGVIPQQWRDSFQNRSQRLSKKKQSRDGT